MRGQGAEMLKLLLFWLFSHHPCTTEYRPSNLPAEKPSHRIAQQATKTKNTIRHVNDLLIKVLFVNSFDSYIQQSPNFAIN